jgi:hypothetical protein
MDNHRSEALKNIREENNDFDMLIEIDVYEVPDINNNMELNSLFKIANNNKNIESGDIPGNKIVELIDSMIKLWPKNIKTNELKSAYRPNITSRALYQALNLRVSESPLSNDEIMTKIINLNVCIGEMSLKEMFGRSNIAKTKLNILEKAKKNDFYLNLDSRTNLEWWVAKI